MSAPSSSLKATISGGEIHLSVFSNPHDVKLKCKEVASKVLSAAASTEKTYLTIDDGGKSPRVVEVDTKEAQVFFERMGFEASEVESALKEDKIGSLVLERGIEQILQLLNVPPDHSRRKEVADFLRGFLKHPKSYVSAIESGKYIELSLGEFVFSYNKGGVKGLYLQFEDKIVDIQQRVVYKVLKPRAVMADLVGDAASRVLPGAHPPASSVRAIPTGTSTSELLVRKERSHVRDVLPTLSSSSAEESVATGATPVLLPRAERSHVRDILPSTSTPSTETSVTPARAGAGDRAPPAMEVSISKRVTVIPPGRSKGVSDVALKVIRKYAPSLKEEELQTLSRSAKALRLELSRKESMKGYPYFHARDTTLARSFEITSEGRILLYLTHTRKGGDVEIGKGGEGVIKAVVDLESGEMFAVKKVDKDHKPGMEILERFKGEEGLAQVVTSFPVPDKKGSEDRTLYRMHFYDTDFFKLTHNDKGDFIPDWWMGPEVDRKTLSPEKSLAIRNAKAKQLFEGLIKGLAKLHRDYKLVHRDIKPDNIFIKFDDKGMPIPYIGDMGFTCSDTEIAGCVGTPDYLCPALLKLPLKEEEKLPPELGKKGDVWALGLTLAESLFPKAFPNVNDLLSQFRRKDVRGVFIILIKLKQSQLDKEPPKGTPQYIVWKMLQVDPDKAISAEEAEAMLKDVKWD